MKKEPTLLLEQVAQKVTAIIGGMQMFKETAPHGYDWRHFDTAEKAVVQLAEMIREARREFLKAKEGSS